MSASFIGDPSCTPANVSLVPPNNTSTVKFHVLSSLASERVDIRYELDPSGSVEFVGGDHTHDGQTKTATASGTPFADALFISGNAPPGTIVTIGVRITGADNLAQIAPAFLVIS